jgi:predicted GTPase
MTGTTSLKLSDLLGTRLPEINSLEKHIQEILQNRNNDADDENEDANLIEDKVKPFIDRRYEILKSIDRTKRIAFWNELNTQLQHLPRRCLTAGAECQMTLLQMVCHFDFTQKPLSFAFEGIHNMNILTECERQLLELIDKLRNEYGLINVLDTQYQAIRNQRRKIVLAIAGGLKAGKSSFINYLLESGICPVGICETTARLTKITYGPRKLVKLESINGELKEQYEINTDDELKTITQNLIALKGADREENLCKDIVTIHLDRKELEYIELWDIPGFDENPFLNSIVEDILKETNIFFILSSSTEAVRETTVNLLRSCSEKHKFQPPVCFIITKIDQVTTNPNAETTLDDMLDQRYNQIQDRFKMKLGEEWKSSPFFIPLCTDPRYNLKDFLVSHEQFTRKLTQFFTHAVRHETLRRLDYLIDTIHELLDYDDLNRSIQRDKKLSDMLTNDIIELHTQISEELKEPFLKIHCVVADKISSVIQLGDDNAVQQALVNEIDKQLSANREEIEQRLVKCLNKLYSKLEKNPALTALIRSLGERRLFGDPYRTVIGQYKSMEDSLTNSAEFFNAAPSAIDIFGHFFPAYLLSFIAPHSIRLTKDYDHKVFDYFKTYVRGLSMCVSLPIFGPLMGIGFGFSTYLHYIVRKNRRLLGERKELVNQARANAASSVETILKELLKDISDHLCQTLCEQLNNISEDVRKRKTKLSEQKETGEAQKIAEFLKKNTSSIVQLYLNLLDKTNRFEYPRCEINLANILGRSNFPVFAGKLGDNTLTDQKTIAAKRVPLKSFIWQEVRYMNELKHENILRYYGVRKSEGIENHYDILMQRLDSDLTKYIDYMLNKEKINDKLMDDIFLQITSGLGYLHAQGLIHRDIKPENILVQLRNGQSPLFILADFGFIHRVPISIKGTEGFLAPELLVNNAQDTFITAKIDIYALGATIQQVLENSSADKKGKYVKFWADISRRCLLHDPFQRPTCEKILEEHNDLTE